MILYITSLSDILDPASFAHHLDAIHTALR